MQETLKPRTVPQRRPCSYNAQARSPGATLRNDSGSQLQQQHNQKHPAGARCLRSAVIGHITKGDTPTAKRKLTLYIFTRN